MYYSHPWNEKSISPFRFLFSNFSGFPNDTSSLLHFFKHLYSIPASFVATKNADVSILSTCAMLLRYENIMLQNSVLQSITPFNSTSQMLS